MCPSSTPQESPGAAAARAGSWADRDAPRFPHPRPETATGRAEHSPRARAPGREPTRSLLARPCAQSRVQAPHAGAYGSGAQEVSAPRSPHRGRGGGLGAPQASGEREATGRGPTVKDNHGRGTPGEEPLPTTGGRCWAGGGGGGPPESQGGAGGGVGRQQRASLRRRRRRRRARSLPASLSAVRRGPGRRRGGARPAPRLPFPPLPPHRPLAPGGRRGGGRRLRVPPPRAPPPPGLLAAIPTLLPRLQQLPVAHGLGGGAASAGLWSGGRARGPGGHPSEGGRGSSGRRSRTTRRWEAAAAWGPAPRLGLSAPSPAFLSPSSPTLPAGASALCEEMV